MSQKARITSITEASAARFLSQSKPRETLSCKNLPGFHLMKLANGASWRWRYTDPTGKRRVATVGSYATFKPQQAASKVHDWITTAADPLQDKSERREQALTEQEQTERRKLQNYLDGPYSRHMARWRPRQAKENYQRIVGHFGFLLDRDMATITRADIQDWQHRIESQGKAYSSIRRIYSSLKTLIRQAVKDEVLKADPLEGFSLDAPSLTAQDHMVEDPTKVGRRMLTQDEVQGLLNGLDLFAEEIRRQRRNSRQHGRPELPDLDKVAYPHLFIPFCLLALHTGLRPGDLRSLRWHELSVRFGRLTKATEKSKSALRKGGKPTVVDIRLNESIKATMSAWWHQQGTPETGLVFPSTRTGGELDKKAYMKPWNRVKALGGLDPGLTFYSLRHHFISAMVKAGVPLLAVAKLAGHRSSEMIESHYGHLCPEQGAQAMDIVAASLETKSEVQGYE